MNGTVLVVTIVVSLAAALLFGTIPALHVAGGGLEASREGGRESTGSRAPARGMLIAVEIALGTIVLIGTALLLRSVVRLNEVALGFEPRHVLTLRVIPRGRKYASAAARRAFYDRVFERIEAIPGVQRAGAITFLPLTLVREVRTFVVEGRPRPAPGEEPTVDSRVVTAGYFAAMGMRIVDGRTFTAQDRPESLPVVVVSASLARAFWPGGRAVGQHIVGSRPGSPPLTVVGVVGDARNVDAVHEAEPTMYLAYGQTDEPQLALRDVVVRTAGDPSAIASLVRDAVWAVDPDLSVARVQSMETVRSVSMAPQSFNLKLLGMMALVALVLSAEGLYGVTAYSVARRTREIGVRIALGADRRQVIRLVLAEGARLTLIGVIAGGIVAVWLTRLMKSLLFGVSPTDPAVYGAVLALTIAVSVAACYVPARRAARVDPATALRCQ